MNMKQQARTLVGVVAISVSQAATGSTKIILTGTGGMTAAQATPMARPAYAAHRRDMTA